MALTRIKTNQITDSAVTTAKIANNAVTAGKLANNLTYSSDLTVSGNLTVGGTTVAVQTDNTRITDAVITLAEGGGGSVDAGLLIDRGAGAVGSGTANQAFLWDENADEFVLADVGTDDGDAVDNLTIGAYADLQVGTINAATVEIGGTAVTSTAAELNLVDGSSAGTIVNSKAVIYGSSGEVNATTLQIGGSSITATAAELNIMDGDTSVGTTAVAGGDGIVTNDSGTMQQTSVDTFDTYLAATTKTLTNKTIDSASNTLTLDLSEGTLTGTTAEFNTALSDDSFATLTNTVTLTNKTLTAPTITSPTVTSLALTDSSIVFEGSTDDANELTLTVDDPAADVTVTIQAATDTLVGRATTDTLTNKTIDSASNTLTLDLSEGTLTGTTAEFNTALSDDTFATLTNTVTLTNKTLTTPTINAGMDIKNGATSAGFVKFFEDSDNGTNAVTLIGPASTADVTLTLPAATDTLVGKATTDTFTNKTIDSANNTLTLDLSEGTLTGTTAEFNTALSDDSFATLTNSVTLTNKTLTAPKIANAGFIADANGNELIIFTTTASAVNEITYANAAASGHPAITTTGSDTNINLVLSPKGSGTIDVDTSKIVNVTDPTSAQDAATKAYVDSEVSSGTALAIAGDSGSDTVTVGTDTFTFSGTSNEITTAVTDNTVTISLPDDVTVGGVLTVTGNLIVNGTTTTLSSTNTIVEDTLIELNTGAGSNANDMGIIMERGSTGDNALFIWDESADTFAFGTTTAVASATGDITYTDAGITVSTISTSGTATLNDATVGGGYGSTGVTISAAGAIQANGALTVDGTSTLGVINASGLASLDGGIDVDGAFTVADTSGNVATTGTLSSGAATLSSAQVSDLTNNRIVIAGASGELEDDANLTFDGTTFEVGGGYGATGLDIAMDGNVSTNGTLTVDGTSTLGVVNVSGLASLDGGIDVDGAFTVADTSGNVATTGTLSSGAATLSSAQVSDLTNNRIVIAGASGELEDDANLTFDGTTFEVGGGYGATGLDIAMDGNVSTNGTLTVDGTSTLGVINASGLASLDGGIDVDGAFTVANTSGNIATSGTLNVTSTSTLGVINASGLASLDGGIDVDGAFTVADTSGNIATSGTLNVTSTSTLGVINASGLASLDGGIDVDGAFTVANTSGNIATTGTLDVTGASSLDGGIEVRNTADDGEAFTVASGSGNVVTTGTLSSGAATLSSAAVSDLTSGRVVLAGTSGELEDSGNLTFNGSTLAVTGAITASSNVDIADAGSLRVGTGNDFTINHDGTNTTIANGTGILAIDGLATSAIRVNEAGANVDFVVEGDSNTALLTVDASADNVGIGGAPNANALLHVNGTGAMIIPVGTTGQRPTGVTGMLRYNSTTTGIEYYDDAGWESISTSFTVATSQTFNGDNSTVAFTLSALSGADSYTVAGVFVTLNGVVQEPTNVYGITGNTLTFTTAPASGDLIEVRKFTTTDTINALADVDGDTQIQVEETSDEDVIRFDIGGSEKMVLNSTQLSVTGNIVATGDITANGDITLGDANTDTITLGAEIGSDVIPDTDGSRDLGSATNRWAEAHIDDVLLGPQGDIRFYDSDASNFVAFQSAATVASNVTWTLPSADAAVSGYALVSNGSGTLSWAAAGATTTSDTTTNAEEQLYFGDITSGAVTAVHHDAGLTYNPSTGTLTADNFSGTASLATSITATANNATNETVYLTFVDGATGTQGIETDTGLSYNPSTNTLTTSVFSGTATNAQYADLAEMYASDEDIEAGTVVCFVGDAKVAECDTDSCKTVAGIVSTDPAHLMNSVQEGVALALAGRVPCKVTGPVAAGDLMVSAGNGMARAEANPSIGTVIGKAIEANEDGEGVIEVLALMM